jgi:GTP-binding protein
MFKNILFYKSVFELDQLPESGLKQLILCGRSNVGKSSFINSISGRKGIAKTSSTPGKTRSINFYSVDDKFFIVDLPGFGYAKTSKFEREKWGRLVSNYIFKTDYILHAFHFIDSRYKPTELDFQLNLWLKSAGLEYSIILNKVDKLNQSETHKAINNIEAYFPGLELKNDFFLYSSITGKWNRSVEKRITELFL